MTARQLFDSNWSYAPEALRELGDAAEDGHSIVQCAACGFAFAQDIPPPALLEFVYERAIDAGKARAANLSAANMAAKMPALSALLQLAPRKQPLKVLDYGCGFGPNLRLLSAIDGVRAWGFETSPARLRELAASGLEASSDLAELASAGPFDAVVLDNVLEHIPEPAQALSRLRDLCAERAAVFVSVPRRPAGDLAALGRGHSGPVPMDVNPLEHLNYFDAGHLDAFMQRAGFRPLRRAELPVPVDVGLRPEPDRPARMKNAAASAARLLRYAATGDVLEDVTARFYRA